VEVIIIITIEAKITMSIVALEVIHLSNEATTAMMVTDGIGHLYVMETTAI